MSDARAPKGAGKVMELGDKSMKVWLRWPAFALVISLALAGCKSNNGTTASITISPGSATILLGTSLQFIPNVTGSSNAIQWSVNGIANGNATFGTISATGLYTAPAIRPISASAVAVPIIFAAANASLPNSGSVGAVIELQSGFDFTNYAPGNTINITGNSVAGWNGSFLIVFSAQLQNGNFGVQISTPPGSPANGVGGTATATPNIVVTAQVESTNAVASAIVALDSGIRVSFTQPSCSIGTNETFSFAPFVSVSGAPTPTPPTPIVTWSLTGVGAIDSNSGLYTAPATTGTATITATSTADPTESASATVTVVTAADPTVTSVNPPTGALGAAFLEVYLSGSNFICTTGVLVNGIPLSTGPTGSLFALSPSSFLVVLPDTVLSTVPTNPAMPSTLTFTVERQGGAPQACSPSPCQLTLLPVRPAVVGITPDSIAQSSPTPVALDGGYFGTNSTITNGGFTGSAVVNVQFAGKGIAAPSLSNADRRLSFTPATSDVSTPGLYPITVANVVTCPTVGAGCGTVGTGSPNGGMASVNLAVQPPPASFPTSPTATVTVGAMPSSVAINTATGIAVVANQGTRASGGLGHDITLIDLTQSPPKALGFICTESVGSILTPPPETACPGSGASEPSGPTSVSVDNLRNLALVTNSGNNTLAIVDLNARAVIALVSFPSADPAGRISPFPLAPQAVAINPVSGRALVAFTTLSGTNGSNAGAILDMNLLQTTVGSVTLPPAVLNVVNLNNGINPHIAVSPRLNWALATPGGAGSLSVVDLARRTTNAITTVSRISNVVSVVISTTPSLQAGQPVLVTGVADPSFNGIFSVASVSNTGFTYEQLGGNGNSSGGTAAYANPVATLATNLNVRGVSINDETQKAFLVDPTSGVPAFVFNILDQTSPAVNFRTSDPTSNNVATAMNPLTNIGLMVNNVANQALVVNPVTPAVIANFPTGTFPVDVAIDPAANTALIVNQKDNQVSLFSLGGLLRSGAPQIVQASFAPTTAPAQTSSRVTINSSLASAATAPDQSVTLIGNFPAGSVPRLDGDPSRFSGISISANGRVMTATLSGTTLATNGPRLYTIDVQNTSTGFSNVVPLQVIQAVSLVTSDCSNPAPQGVAIDATHNVAVVTEPGCNPTGAGDVSMVNLTNNPGAGLQIGTGFGGAPELAVGNNPQGVAVYPQSGLAVVANAGSNTVSIADVVNDDIATTFAVDPIPTGVAVNLGTGNAVVTANGASVADTFPVSTSSQTPSTISVQQGPTGVAIDPKTQTAVVANSNSNTASILDLSSKTNTHTSNPIALPQGVAFDPILNNFLITSSASNQVTILNPNTVFSSAIRVGIDPSSIAYNFESGTLVTANNLSGTVTVVDFVDETVRGVFSLFSSTRFAVDIHPQTNLAVVADTAENQLLLVPLPH